MKKLVVLWALVLAAATAPVPASAQSSGDSYYVSAAGNDENDGLSEAAAFKTLRYAVLQADDSEHIKIVIVIGTLNQASEGSSSTDDEVFFLTPLSGNEDKPILITGIPGAPAGRRGILSALGTEKNCVDTFGAFSNVSLRFEHIEISGSVKMGITISSNSSVILGNGAVVRNNGGAGVFINVPRDEYRDTLKPGALTLDGGEIRNNADSGVEVYGILTLRSGAIANNKSSGAAGGVFVGKSGVFTMSGGSITGNSTATSEAYGGGGVAVGGQFVMSGGSITGNTATGEGGGVFVASGGVFNQTGGSVSSNRTTRSSYLNIYAAQGATANLPQSSTSAPSTASTPRPASPPRQEGSLSSGTISAADSPSPAPAWTRRPQPSVDFGFTAHLNLYAQGWHENVVSLGIPLQLGFELELPFITLDVLGEASAGIGYGNFFEYHLGGMGELYFFDQSFGLGAGMGLYGNDFNMGDVFDSGSSSGAKGSVIAYARPVTAKYYRFALIFRGESKTTLYGEVYEDGNWGFGLMWGGVLTD